MDSIVSQPDVSKEVQTEAVMSSSNIQLIATTTSFSKTEEPFIDLTAANPKFIVYCHRKSSSLSGIYLTYVTDPPITGLELLIYEWYSKSTYRILIKWYPGQLTKVCSGPDTWTGGNYDVVLFLGF